MNLALGESWDESSETSTIGLDLYERLEKLHREEGPFYRPCELLLAMARKTKKFHPRKTSRWRPTRIRENLALTK